MFEFRGKTRLIMQPSVQHTCYVVMLVVILLTGCASPPPDVSMSDQQKEQAALASSDHLIVPGQRIGPVHLGMFKDEILEVLGMPNTRQPEMNAPGREKWVYLHLNLIVYVSGGATPSIDEITTLCLLHGNEGNLLEAEWSDVDAPNTVFQTQEGIKLGTTSFEVQRRFSNYRIPNSAGFIMNYKTAGVQFLVTREHEPRVVRISISRPEP